MNNHSHPKRDALMVGASSKSTNPSLRRVGARCTSGSQTRTLLKTWSSRFALPLGLVLLISSGLRAPSGSAGEITGAIQDPSGAAVANAEVLVVNQDTGITVAQVVATG